MANELPKYILIQKSDGLKSKPFTIEWLINHFYEDLEFENGETLPVDDFMFFKEDYEIQLLLSSEQSVQVSDTTKADGSNTDGNINQNSDKGEEAVRFAEWLIMESGYSFSMLHTDRGVLFAPTLLENQTKDDLVTTQELYQLFLNPVKQ